MLTLCARCRMTSTANVCFLGWCECTQALSALQCLELDRGQVDNDETPCVLLQLMQSTVCSVLFFFFFCCCH